MLSLPEKNTTRVKLKLPEDEAVTLDRFVEFIRQREGRGDRDLVVEAILEEELCDSNARIWRQFREWREGGDRELKESVAEDKEGQKSRSESEKSEAEGDKNRGKKERRQKQDVSRRQRTRSKPERRSKS